MIAGAPREGKEEGGNLIEAKDAGGNTYIKTLVQQKEGQLRYTGSDGRQKIAVFTHYAPWNWVIVGEAAVDEITREPTRCAISTSAWACCSWRCWARS